MKGLLLKDFFTIGKSLRVFLLMIVVFACLPGFNMAIFAVVYAALLPMTAITYDERCKWDTMAAMLPYSPAELVVSKYLLGYIAVLGAAVLALIVHTVYGLVGVSSGSDYVSSVVGGAFTGLLIMALSLPAIFKFGVEKGRLLFFVILLAVFGGGAAAMAMTGGGALSSLANGLSKGTGLGLILALIAINALSICLSIKFYSKKEF